MDLWTFWPLDLGIPGAWDLRTFSLHVDSSVSFGTFLVQRLEIRDRPEPKAFEGAECEISYFFSIATFP